jgi:hypothetical protein
MSTVNLLAPNSLGQLLLILKNTFFLQKQAILIRSTLHRPSTSVRIHCFVPNKSFSAQSGLSLSDLTRK